MITEKEKQIPPKLLDHEYMEKFFSSHAKEIDNRIKSVAKMNIYPIKQHIDDVYFHLVNMYVLTFFLQDGSRKRRKIIGATYSGHKRRKMFQVMKLAYEHGFKSGKILVPRPLWYIEDLQAVFYMAVDGDNLLMHIKNGARVDKTIKKSAGFLARFHQIKPPNSLKLEKSKFNWEYFDPTNILDLEKNKEHEYTQQIKKYYKILEKHFKKLDRDKFEMSHGDFHPENVIINRFDSSQIAIIDFSEACLAPYTFDVGSFLQQLRFMSLAYDVTAEKFKKWQKIFLDEYFSRRGIELNKDIERQINLFQARTALKSAIYYMIYKTQYKHVEALLKQIEESLENL